jgi:Uma2 family endonuclease
MKAFAKRPANYEDLRQVPDEYLAQIVDGDLIASPRPSSSHARALSVLGIELGGAFDRGRGGPGGWWILDEPELHFGSDVVVPDLAGWRREKMPRIPQAPFLELAPDWVCEVLSPGTAAVDRVRKMRIYARERVAHIWLVDPLERTLEVFRLTEAGYLEAGAYSAQEHVRAEPFDAVELELGVLWLSPEGP